MKLSVGIPKSMKVAAMVQPWEDPLTGSDVGELMAVADGWAEKVAAAQRDVMLLTVSSHTGTGVSGALEWLRADLQSLSASTRDFRGSFFRPRPAGSSASERGRHYCQPSELPAAVGVWFRPSARSTTPEHDMP